MLKNVWGPLSPLGLAAALLALGIDQAHKWWMIQVYRIGEKGKVEVGPFLDLVMVRNHGISFGLFPQNSSLGRYILISAALLAVIALAVWLARVTSALAAISVGLIIGGALGNTIDRMLYGAVADFFRFHAGGLSWYVFNLADAAIVAGAAGLLCDSLRGSHKKVSKTS